MTETVEIKKFEGIELPNVFYSGGDLAELSETMMTMTKMHLAMSILTKGSRTSNAEFKFIVDTMRLKGELQLLGDTGNHVDPKNVSKTAYEDVYNGTVEMGMTQDHIVRNILIMSLMKADPMLMFAAKKVVMVSHLLPESVETIPVISAHMYTITVNIKPSVIASDMQRVYEKHLPKDEK